MAGKLKNGNPGANGGKREGAGRKPDWLKAKCQKILKDKKLIEFLGNVANGDNVEQVVNAEGEVISLPPPIKDRIKATEILLDRGFGKVPTTLHAEDDKGNLVPVVIALPVQTKGAAGRIQ